MSIAERLESMKGSFDEKVRQVEKLQDDIAVTSEEVKDLQAKIAALGFVEERQLRLAEIRYEKGNILPASCTGNRALNNICC
jgi:peptidoglycan hydrolase CwlO-like protein